MPAWPSSPMSRATAAAVAGWSPVTMITRMPAARHSVMASRTPSRTGSSKASKPPNSKPSSGSVPLHSSAGNVRDAQAITLWPVAASSSTRRSHRTAESGGRSAIAITVSGAPLTTTTNALASWRHTADSRRRCSVNGNTAIRVCVELAAGVAASSAASRGSPLSARAAWAARRSRLSSSCPGAGRRCASTRSPAVMVPVLSEQMQVTRPMFSTATARRTSALRCASRYTPSPRKKV